MVYSSKNVYSNESYPTEKPLPHPLWGTEKATHSFDMLTKE